jgi:hypothetical protein
MHAPAVLDERRRAGDRGLIGLMKQRVLDIRDPSSMMWQV